MVVWVRVLQFDIKCEEFAPAKDKWVKYDEERIKKLRAAPQTPLEDADLSSKIFFWLPSSYVHFVTGNLLTLLMLGGGIECLPLAKSASVLRRLTFFDPPYDYNSYLYTVPAISLVADVFPFFSMKFCSKLNFNDSFRFYWS